MTTLPDHVQKAVEDVIRKENLTGYKIEVTPGSNAGDNYGSIIYRIKIDGKKDNAIANLSLICKVPIIDLKTSPAFQREIHIYTNVLEELHKLQKEKNIDYKNGFNSDVKCYATDDTEGKEYLILEDLKPKNFIMIAKDSYINKQHAELAVKELAKLHAFSFAMKAQKPEIFKKLSYLPESMIEVMGEQTLFNLCKASLTRALSCCDPKHKNHIQDMMERIPKIIQDVLKRDASEDNLVINHADCWKNNAMFKYENGDPVEICLFDWQITRLASPAADFCYFMYVSGDEELIQQHFDIMVDIYYEQLTKTAKLLGNDITNQYSRQILNNDIKKCAKLGILFAVLSMNVMLADVPPEMIDLFNKAQDENTKVECFANLNIEAMQKYASRVNVMFEQANTKGFLL